MPNSSSDEFEPSPPRSQDGSFRPSVLDSETKYRRLFEESQEGIVIATPSGEILDVNPAACALNGYSREELLGMNAAELYAEPEKREEVMRTLREEGEVRGTKLRVHRKDGEEILCQVSVTPWRNGEDEIEALQAFIRDISERRRGEEQFRHLVEEVKEYAIFMLDADGHVTSWNEGAERIKGYAEEEILGTHFSTFHPPEAVEAGRPSRGLEAAARDGQWTDEGWRLRKDGSRFWAHVTITALTGKDGTVRGFAKVTRDMTERHRRELSLERQKQRAEEVKQRARRENMLLRLMQGVATTANEADSLEEALQEAVDLVCEHIGWPVGHVYWVHEGEQPRLVPSEIWCLDEDERFDRFREVTEAMDFALGESLPGRVTSTGEPVWIQDVTADSNFVRTTRADTLGVKGAFGVPIPLDGGTVAVLEFFSESEEEPDERLVEAMESVGVQLSRVAERERAQKALRRSERRYRRLFETSQEGIVIQAADWTVTDLNPATEDILGYDRDELLGRNPTDLFVNLDQYRRAQRRIQEEGYFQNLEFDMRRRDGEVIVCEATSIMQREAEDEEEVFYTIFRDVTERKRMQEALEESEERYRRLFEESRDAVVLTTPDGEIVDANGAAEELFGYAREELLRLDAAELYADPEERSRRIVPELVEATAPRMLEAEMRHRDGHTFPATASVTVHRDEDGRPELIQALVRDVTEERRLREELLQVQDEERQRLGQELHDGVCSLLTGVGILTSSLAGEVRAGEEIDPEDLDEATELVQQAADETRAISHGLSPVQLKEGLCSALEDLASQMEVRGDLDCSFEASGSMPDLSKETALYLYRIVQEATNNAIKHADAEHVHVSLAADDEALTLTVQDDGQGYSGSSSGDEGIGVRTMRYRADLMGASLSIEETPDGGTLVRCRLPVRERS